MCVWGLLLPGEGIGSSVAWEPSAMTQRTRSGLAKQGLALCRKGQPLITDCAPCLICCTRWSEQRCGPQECEKKAFKETQDARLQNLQEWTT